MKRSTDTLSSVRNTVKILKEYTKDDAELGITELSKRTGLTKSSVNRIIQTLYDEDVLYKNPRTHKYRLGITIFELGSVVYNELSIGQIAIPIFEKIKDKVRGDIHVVTYDKGDIVYLQRIPERLRALIHIGGRIRSHGTAAGKLLLAYQEAEEIDRVLQNELVAYTNRTITSSKELKSELDRIKSNGYSVSIGEFIEGICSIAVPIYNDSKKVIAAISLTRENMTPTNAKITELVNQLKMCSRLITENMVINDYNNSIDL
ncbi:IclR family transcriptional regulator [Pseudalkalibacillus sp. A8]|uniref:IclR family transcriptional regulator n=1 Tax=Pseudalkalibacillus sp. A8 TaxID=3382641 RepID=UPI0038B5B5BC